MDFFKNLLLACLITLFMQGCKEGGQENQCSTEIQSTTHSYELNLGGVPLKVEVAALAKEREKGLMFRKSLGLNEGMLFIFKKGTKQPNGTYLAEPVIDVKDVAKTVMHMIKLPLNTNILNTTIMANNMPFIGRG